MSVYTRFKKDPDGFRKLVSLLETTPLSRRKNMIYVGMAEDPDYTQKAQQYMFSFEDILKLNDAEVAALLAEAPPRIAAVAINQASKEIQGRWLQCAKGPRSGEISDHLGAKPSLTDIGAAQLKLIEIARKLERKGLIKAKRIPEGTPP